MRTLTFLRRALPLLALPLVKTLQLPVLDGRELSSPEGSEAHNRFVAALLRASSEVGFFYIANSTVAETVQVAALDAAERFFAMPTPAKEGMSYEASPAFRGYMRVGVENTGGLTDLREQVEFGPEWPPAAAAGTTNANGSPPSSSSSASLSSPSSSRMKEDKQERPLYERLVGPNQWPEEGSCPGCRAAITAFAEASAVLSARLTRALMLALGHPADAADHAFFGDGGSPHLQY